MILKYKDFKRLSELEMRLIKGGEETCEELNYAQEVLCVECSSDSGCNYKPNLYCGNSYSCPQYVKVCKRTVIC